MSDPAKAAVMPGLSYADPVAAYRWLQSAFGFEPLTLITEPDGALIHAEVGYRGCAINSSKRRWPDQAPPSDVGGRNTQSLHVQLSQDVDAHFARAAAAGAEVLMAPQDQPYGDRNYMVKDLEGHVWSFAQTVQPMTDAEYAARTGAKVEGLSPKEN